MVLSGFTDTKAVNQLMTQLSGKVAYDVGANAGFVTRALAMHFEEVIAFECAEESFRVLKDSVPRNVIPVACAVSDKMGTIGLEERSAALAAGELVTANSGEIESIWGERTGTRWVPATTLDQSVFFYGVPDFVKIDTEGHEAHVVAGGQRLFKEHHPRVLIEVHKRDLFGEIKKMMPDYDWRVFPHVGYSSEQLLRDEHFWIWSG